MGGSMTKEGKDRIVTCKKTGGTELNLSDCEISKVESFKAITKLKLLRKLNLSRNALEAIPPSVRKLVNLEYLDISFNMISGEASPDLFSLPSLKHLDVRGNQFVSLPSDIGDVCTSLEWLDISRNSIADLPSGFTRFQSLVFLGYTHSRLSRLPPQVVSLKALRHLDVSGNDGIVLPDDLSNLVALEELNMSECLLDEFPAVVTRLPRLARLNLSSNRLDTLPSDLGELSRLTHLDASNNHLVDVSNLDARGWVAIEELLFRGNKLTKFVSYLGHVSTLRVLDLGQNELEAIPRQVGWIGHSMRKLLVDHNAIETIPGELTYLNPAIKFDVEFNPVKPPFFGWLETGYMTLLDNLKPYLGSFPDNCYAEGADLSVSQAGVPCQFAIEANDKEGLQRVTGGDHFQVEFRGVDSLGNERSESAVVKDNRNGSYTVFFNFPFSGNFHIHITNEGDPIKGSPYATIIAAGDTDIFNCTMGGSGLSSGKVGEISEFAVSAVDRFGYPQTHGDDPWEVVIEAPGGERLRPLKKYIGDGKTKVAFSPTWVGKYTIRVSLNGEFHPRCPFECMVDE